MPSMSPVKSGLPCSCAARRLPPSSESTSRAPYSGTYTTQMSEPSAAQLSAVGRLSDSSANPVTLQPVSRLTVTSVLPYMICHCLSSETASSSFSSDRSFSAFRMLTGYISAEPMLLLMSSLTCPETSTAALTFSRSSSSSGRYAKDISDSDISITAGRNSFIIVSLLFIKV